MLHFVKQKFECVADPSDLDTVSQDILEKRLEASFNILEWNKISIFLQTTHVYFVILNIVENEALLLEWWSWRWSWGEVGYYYIEEEGMFYSLKKFSLDRNLFSIKVQVFSEYWLFDANKTL